MAFENPILIMNLLSTRVVANLNMNGHAGPKGHTMRIIALTIILFQLVVCSALAQSKSQQTLSTTISEDIGIVPMVQAVTSETQAQFNILSPRATEWVFVVSIKGQEEKPLDLEIDSQEVSHTDSLHKVYKVIVTGLDPEKEYSLSILEDNVEFDRRYFKTFKSKGQDIRFAFSSCMANDDKFYYQGLKLWKQLEKLSSELDFILLNGDTVYTDIFNVFGFLKPPTPDKIWERYVDSFKTFHLYRFKSLVPILATWNDHDYGINDGDRTWGRLQNDWNPVAESFKSFKAFFGSNEIDGYYQNSPGVSSHFQALGHQFILLDNRTFRAPDEYDKSRQKNPAYNPQDSNYAHFGKEQEEFLIKHLSRSDVPTFIVSGGPFLGDTFKRSLLNMIIQRISIYLKNV